MEASSGVTAAGSYSGTTSTARSSSNESSEFMLMLMAQLRNQNPLDPMQDKDMMGQVAQLNSLEELKSIRTMMKDSSQAGNSAYGIAMIGKEVTAVLESGDVVQGKVTGASWQSNKMFLQVGDEKVPLESVTQVSGE